MSDHPIGQFLWGFHRMFVKVSPPVLSVRSACLYDQVPARLRIDTIGIHFSARNQMKGIIFTSFVEFTEKHFGMEFVDQMLDLKATSSAGSYTTVGTYPSAELLDMFAYVCEVKLLDPVQTAKDFGEFVFTVLVDRYTHLVSEYDSAMQCLYHVDQTIHKSVQKLYPDATLPDMQAQLSADGRVLDMNYSSSRPLMYVAYGLIIGCVNYFGDKVSITMTDHSDGKGNQAHFRLVVNE